jgi:predicted phage terminase large subunit-like protein
MTFPEVLRADPLTFAKRAHFELHQSHLGDDPYLELLAYDLERIITGQIPRYICNMPPGHCKTFFFSITLSALILGRNPSARILVVSYGEDLATEITRKTRRIVQAPWYGEAFPRTKLAKDHRAARDFGTTVGGRVCARSFDGAVTGVRCDYLIVDDPVQIRDSANLAHLESVNARFTTDVAPRLNNPATGTIVVVHHRLNKSDLTGYLEKRRGFRLRRLALVAPETREYRLRKGVWRRKQGEVLRPDAYSPDYVADLRENTGAPGFDPLYQQSFDGPDVLQIRREDFVVQPFYASPAVPFILSIDPNHKGEKGRSYSVIQCWGLLTDGRYLLCDQWRERAHKSVFAGQIRSMKAQYRPQLILIEDNGPALEFQAQFESQSCPVVLIEASANKLARLRPHLDLFRRRRIVLRLDLPHMEELMVEFETFPYGVSDDLVDAATQFFDFVRSTDFSPISRPWPVMGALGNVRQARAALHFNAGRPTRYVFSRR